MGTERQRQEAMLVHKKKLEIPSEPGINIYIHRVRFTIRLLLVFLEISVKRNFT